MYRGKEIGVEELKNNSHIKVLVKCPSCGTVRETPYKRITSNGHYLCQGCALRKVNENKIRVGEGFGRWTAIGKGTKSGYSLCKCKCGTTREVNNSTLRKGLSKSCGCISVERNAKNRKLLKLGSQYGRLTVIGHSKKSGFSLCKCSCGEEVTVSNPNLTSGKTRSCGCIRREEAAKRLIKLNARNSMEKHWNWKGGTSTERELAMSRRNYKDWRTSVFERDEFTCQKCGQWGRFLHAHHIYNYADHPEIRLEPTNGITFCEECHREFHRINGMKTNKEQLDDFLSSKTTAN